MTDRCDGMTDECEGELRTYRVTMEGHSTFHPGADPMVTDFTYCNLCAEADREGGWTVEEIENDAGV